MSKLMDRARSSKLNTTIVVEKNTTNEAKKEFKKESTIRKIKPKDYPRSFRLDSEEINLLKDLMLRVNEISPRKIGESRLIRALIILANEIPEDKLIKALKEAW